jgi:protein-disulfide isomerase
MTPRSPGQRLIGTALCLTAWLGACATGGPEPETAEALAQTEASSADGALQTPLADALPTPSEVIPVEADDAAWGDPMAPVTVVAFMDLQCPFCGRALPTLDALQRRFGPERLRVVVKHHPLPFHGWAAEAANIGVQLRLAHGSEAFFQYAAEVFRRHPEINGKSDAAGALVSLATDLGYSPRLPREAPDADAPVKRDMALAARLGQQAVPIFYVNGALIRGAQPLEHFTSLVEGELEAFQTLEAEGVLRPDVYAARVRENFQAPETQRAETRPPDTRVWEVPVGSSAVLGPADALVTVVQFTDFQCPYCERAQLTLERLRETYGSDLRVVFKHNPLPFHGQALPSALFALEARRQRGEPEFWRASRKLFESERLEEADLQRIARELRLDWAAVKGAIAAERGVEEIRADQALALRLGARGTPHSFINGRSLSGAQPFEVFAEVVDEQLAIARDLLKSGVPRARIYETLQRGATRTTDE